MRKVSCMEVPLACGKLVQRLQSMQLGERRGREILLFTDRSERLGRGDRRGQNERKRKDVMTHGRKSIKLEGHYEFGLDIC